MTSSKSSELVSRLPPPPSMIRGPQKASVTWYRGESDLAYGLAFSQLLAAVYLPHPPRPHHPSPRCISPQGLPRALTRGPLAPSLLRRSPALSCLVESPRGHCGLSAPCLPGCGAALTFRRSLASLSRKRGWPRILRHQLNVAAAVFWGFCGCVVGSMQLLSASFKFALETLGLQKASRHAVRTPGHMQRPHVGALVNGPS